MAESIAPKDENPLYDFNLMRRIWSGYLRRTGRGSRHMSTLTGYFDNFVINNRSYEFSITTIFDETSQMMVDREMYFKMKEELEKNMASVTLPDINPLDMSSPNNVVQKRKAFTSKEQFNTFTRQLDADNENVRKGARKKATEHCKKLRMELTPNQEEKTLVAFDLEVHDKDRKTILEIGSVKFTFKKDDQPEYFHAIVTDNLHLVNSNITDNREKFKLGTSQRMSLKDAAAHLQNVIEGADFLVVHAGINEKKYLKENGIDTGEKTTFDTQIMALELLTSRNPNMLCWGLKRMLETMGIGFQEDILHNAGNDAHYTMLAFKNLVGKIKYRHF